MHTYCLYRYTNHTPATKIMQIHTHTPSLIADHPHNTAMHTIHAHQQYDNYMSMYLMYMWLLLPLPVSPPEVTITGATNSQVDYETTAHGNATRVIAGYEVTRFGVPMIGQYENTGRGSRVTISPAVPGAQYRITAWALGDGRRSATPAVVEATTGEAGALCEIVGTDFLHLSHFLPRYIL